MIKITLSDEAKKRVQAEYLTLSALSFLTKLPVAVEKFVTKKGEKIDNELEDFCKNFSQIDNIKRVLLADEKALNTIKDEYVLSTKNVELLSDFFEAKYTTLQTSHAHWFGKITQTKVCPYCNINFVYAYDKDKVTFQLDHFYPKDKYPYLALSFYNLIPCCGSCNHKKGIKSITTHPYSEALDYEIQVRLQSKKDIREQLSALKMENWLKKQLKNIEDNGNEIIDNQEKRQKEEEILNECELKLKGLSIKAKKGRLAEQEKINKKQENITFISNKIAELKKKEATYIQEIKDKIAEVEKLISDTFGINFFYGNLDSFSLEFEPSADKAQALNENITTFHLRERYQEHKDYAYELVKKSWYYSPSYIAALYDTYAGTLFSSEEEIKRLAIGNYYQAEDMGKRPLSKLTRDIAKQFNLY